MRAHDAADDPLASYQDDPVDHIEPGQERPDETHEQTVSRIEHEAFREAAMKMIVFMHASFAFIHEASTEAERGVRLWVVSSTIDHPACDGRNDSELAAFCGTTRANFSKHKLTFQRQNSLPPNLTQKSVEARTSYREARESQLS